MLQQEEPEDFVIATGEVHSVREFVVEAFKHVGKTIVWVHTYTQSYFHFMVFTIIHLNDARAGLFSFKVRQTCKNVLSLSKMYRSKAHFERRLAHMKILIYNILWAKWKLSFDIVLLVWCCMYNSASALPYIQRTNTSVLSVCQVWRITDRLRIFRPAMF